MRIQSHSNSLPNAAKIVLSWSIFRVAIYLNKIDWCRVKFLGILIKDSFFKLPLSKSLLLIIMPFWFVFVVSGTQIQSCPRSLITSLTVPLPLLVPAQNILSGIQDNRRIKKISAHSLISHLAVRKKPWIIGVRVKLIRIEGNHKGLPLRTVILWKKGVRPPKK